MDSSAGMGIDTADAIYSVGYDTPFPGENVKNPEIHLHFQRYKKDFTNRKQQHVVQRQKASLFFNKSNHTFGDQQKQWNVHYPTWEGEVDF